jgi:mRNA interferase MazF
MAEPRRGEIWLADLRPTHGREQAGRRPVLVLSVDSFNSGPADLVINRFTGQVIDRQIEPINA